MMPEITIDISPESEALLKRITNSTGLLRAVAREMDAQNQLTIGHLTEKRLTGTGPFPVAEHKLGVRTGHLRRSVRATKAVVEGDTIYSAIGSNVKYAGIHEFGFKGSVMVAGHIRKRFAVREFLGAPAKTPVFKASTTARRKGESDQAFFARSAAREQFARRKFEEKLQLAQYESRESRVIRRKVRVGDQHVKTHKRNVDYPARAPFRYGIMDRVPEIGAGISRAVKKFWNGGSE